MRSPRGEPWFHGLFVVTLHPEGAIGIVKVIRWLRPEPTIPNRLTNAQWLSEEFAMVGSWSHDYVKGIPKEPGVYEGVLYAWGNEDDSGFDWRPVSP